MLILNIGREIYYSGEKKGADEYPITLWYKLFIRSQCLFQCGRSHREMTGGDVAVKGRANAGQKRVR